LPEKIRIFNGEGRNPAFCWKVGFKRP